MKYFVHSAYERGHQRPPLTVYTFQVPGASHSQPASPVSVSDATGTVTTITTSDTNRSATVQNSSQQPAAVASPQKSPHKPPQNPIYARPPIPQRCSSLERPSVPAKTVATTQHRPATVATTMAKQPHTTQVTKAEVPKIPKAVMQHVHLGKGTVNCTSEFHWYWQGQLFHPLFWYCYLFNEVCVYVSIPLDFSSLEVVVTFWLNLILVYTKHWGCGIAQSV